MKKHNSVALLAFILTSSITPALAKIPLEVSLPKLARPGETVAVTVRTEPKAKCKIQAQDAGIMQGLKLEDQTANGYGVAIWRFEIPKDYRANEMPVSVTVDKNGQEERFSQPISIKK